MKLFKESSSTPVYGYWTRLSPSWLVRQASSTPLMMGATAPSNVRTYGTGRLAGPAEDWSRDSISLPHGSSV
eukprot:798047-Amphidinium_carterae.1